MPAKSRPPISVLGVLTIDGWDQRQKEFRNLYQTQTIGDISWMSFRRNRQAGHRMTISLENDWRTCMRNIPSVSETMEIPSRASVQNTMFMRSMLLHILIALISEKTLEERKRQEAHRTYTDFKSDGTLIESGKIENLKVKELGFYLKEHGLTTIGRKLDKVKAIRCHYYRHIKESVNTDARIVRYQRWKWRGIRGWRIWGRIWQWGGRERQWLFFNNLDEKSDPSQTMQFISDDQICKVVVQGSWDVSINIDVTCLHIVTLAFCGGWDRRGGIMKSSTANVGGSKPHCML